MQSVSSRIWTRVAVSISYDDNHYTTESVYHADLLFCVTIEEFHNNGNSLFYKEISCMTDK